MTEVGANTRHYGMDWLRIGAFQLLILYHVGMAFVPWGFSVKMGPPADWTVIPMFLTNPWRLSLLFTVSGFASAALHSKSEGPGAFVRSRLARLGVPLLFGCAVIVVPQPWVELVTQHGYAHGFWWFVAHDYFRPQIIDGVLMPTYMHLWFVLYLLAYTLAFGALLTLPEAWKTRIATTFERLLAGPQLLPLGIAYFYVVRFYLSPGVEDSHMFVNDWSAHASYFAAFLFGVLLRRSERLQATVRAAWAPAAALWAIGYAFTAGCEIAWPGNTPLPHQFRWVHGLARGLQIWAAIVALCGIADRFWNRDHAWRPMLAEAVFPFYIVHQTIIIVVGYWLLATDTNQIERFAILVAATAGGCWAFYGVGRTIDPLRPLIGLNPRKRPYPQYPAATASTPGSIATSETATCISTTVAAPATVAS